MGIEVHLSAALTENYDFPKAVFQNVAEQSLLTDSLVSLICCETVSIGHSIINAFCRRFIQSDFQKEDSISVKIGNAHDLVFLLYHKATAMSLLHLTSIRSQASAG